MTSWSQYRLELRDVFSLSLVYCEELESTDTITVNITSTAMGSISVEMVPLMMCTLLSVPVMESGTLTLSLLWTVYTKSDNESQLQYAKQCMSKQLVPKVSITCFGVYCVIVVYLIMNLGKLTTIH